VSAALEAAQRALDPGRAWLVGGSVRDRLLGRDTSDVDLAVAGDVEDAARALAQAGDAHVFPLSEAFGAWRVSARDGAWQADLAPLQGDDLTTDLGHRDFTINAMAAPVTDPASVVDLHGGQADLGARRLRLVSDGALDADPLRTLRAVRIAAELRFDLDPALAAAVPGRAPLLATAVSPERVFAELKRILQCDDPVRGIRLADELRVLDAVLPEVAALRGIGQGIYHHLDVFEHTLAVLEATVDLERDPTSWLGDTGARVAARLAEPLADGLSRGEALRLGALLHDAAKSGTRQVFPNGRVGFPGHDRQGADLAREVLTRLRTSEKLRAHVAALTRHHLAVGFLVHERPLPRRTVWAYLRDTAPVTVDVTVLTVADRLATRGRKADEAIAKHLDLARELLGEALADEEADAAPLVRGDELAAALGRPPGPWLATALAEIAAARFAGEITTPEEAVLHAQSREG
jgi:poly(A) polymerase